MYSGEKDAIQQQIDEAFKKYEGDSVPVPIRGPAIRAVATANDQEAEAETWASYQA